MAKKPSPSSLNRRDFIAKSALTLGALTGAGALLDACAPGTSTGKQTLHVMYDSAEALIGTDLLKQFEQDNHCTLQLTKFDQLRLNASLAAGNPPDFVRTNGASEMPNLVARGLAENLDPYFARSQVLKTADLDAVTGVYRFDGKVQGQGPIYGFPIDFSQDSMMWFNKKLFAAAGIPYLSGTDPVTYDQLLEYGKRLTVRTGDKIQVYGLDPTWNFVNQAHLLQMIAQQGGSLWNADFTKADFTTPEARKALQWYVDWAQARVGVSPLDPSTDWEGPIYNTERMAIVTFGYWFNAWINGTDTSEDTHGLIDRSGFAPAPQFGSTRVDACMSGTGAWIPKKAANKDLAFKLMEFWFGGAPAHKHFQGGGGLPGLKSLRSYLPQTTATDKEHFTVQQNNLPHLSVLQFSPYASGSAMEGAITSNIEAAMKGQVSLDTAIHLLQSQVTTIIEQGREQIGA